MGDELRELMGMLKDKIAFNKKQTIMNNPNSEINRIRASNQKTYDRIFPTYAEQTSRMQLGSNERIAEGNNLGSLARQKLASNAMFGTANINAGAHRDVAGIQATASGATNTANMDRTRLMEQGLNSRQNKTLMAGMIKPTDPKIYNRKVTDPNTLTEQEQPYTIQNGMGVNLPFQDNQQVPMTAERKKKFQAWADSLGPEERAKYQKYYGIGN